ncbi:MAG: carboxypeptidase regulatory-like domain-containing protein, partial [Proteobacteria bacterium]|nr:carboxypeptidase regulatory-like domain-containing protein [Pseudomonadota bacterium]
MRSRVAIVAISLMMAGDPHVANLPSAIANEVLPPIAHVGTIARDPRAGAGAPVAPDDLPPVEVPIAGWLVDAAGAPVEGVRVTRRDPTGTSPDRIVVSGPRGEFRIEPAGGHPLLMFDAANVFSTQVTWNVDGPPPRILLARRARLETRVVVDGHVVAGAEVRITDGSEPTLATARTDAAGIARFPDLVPGPYEVWAIGAAIGSALASPIVRISDIGPEAVELVLEPAGGVHGQVLAAAEPSSGPADARTLVGSVQLTPLDVDHAIRSVTLDDHGRFALDGLPLGRWRVEATLPGYVQGLEQEVVVTAHAADIVVRVEHAGAMTGTVVDARGEPVGNATIVVRRQGADGARPWAPAPEAAQATSFGRVRWVYPFAARRQLPTNAAARFGGPRPGTRAAECGEGHCGIDLVMPRGAVVHATADGEVVVASTEIRGESGRFVAIDHGGGLVTMYMHLDQVREGLEPGQKIRAGTPVGTVGSTGFDPSKAVPHLHFAVTQNRGGRTWYLDPEAMLRHAVVLATPRSLERIEGTVAVAARSELATPTAALAVTTDARGRFRVDDLPPGAYVAVAFAPELAPGTSEPITVHSGGATDGGVVALHPGVMVRGRIVDRAGPVSGATIVATAGVGEAASNIATTYTNAQGEYVLRALAGKITLAVTAVRYGEASRVLELDGRDGRASSESRREDFSLVIEDAQLRGLVRSPDGGVAGASVRIVDGPTRRTVITDASGQFTIGRVAAGRYVLEVSALAYPSTRLTLDSDRFGEVRLEQGGSARVLVSDTRGGDPLAGIQITARAHDGATITRTTDARGVLE